MTLLDLCALTCIGWSFAHNLLDDIEYTATEGSDLLRASEAAIEWRR